MAHPTHSRATAQVIALPTASAAPVQQQRGPGRHPKSIVNLRRFRYDKQIAETAAHRRPKTLHEKLKSEHEMLRTCECLLATIGRNIAALQQQLASTQETNRSPA